MSTEPNRQQELLDTLYRERFGPRAIAPAVQPATLPNEPAPADSSTTPNTEGTP